jgi:arsenite methyltransferase
VPIRSWFFNRGPKRRSSRSREIIDRLDLRPGQSVVDIGAGGGAFTYEFARRVGPAGAVYAVDVKLATLDAIRRESLRRGLGQVVPVFVRRGDFVLPEGTIDLVFVRDVLRHLPDPAAVFTKLRHHLSDGGRIAVVEPRPRVPGGFIQFGQGVDPRKVRSDMDRWGYDLLHDWDTVPRWTFLVFTPKKKARSA